jgi:hypothetical protein
LSATVEATDAQVIDPTGAERKFLEASGARAERMTDPELALLLALRAYRLHPDAETDHLRATLSHDERPAGAPIAA